MNFAKQSNAKEFIIGTVDGVFYKIHEQAPDKKLYRVRAVQECTNMKKVTLEKIIDVLENETNEVFLDETIAKAAIKPLEKMLELAQ